MIKAVNFTTVSLKNGLKENHIEICLTNNEGKPVVAKIFVRNLKNKIFKHTTAVSKNVHKYNSTYHKKL